MNCGNAAREGALGYDSAHRCNRSAHCLTVGANIVRPHNVKSYVFPIVNPVSNRDNQPHHRNRRRQKHCGSCGRHKIRHAEKRHEEHGKRQQHRICRKDIHRHKQTGCRSNRNQSRCNRQQTHCGIAFPPCIHQQRYQHDKHRADAEFACTRGTAAAVLSPARIVAGLRFIGVSFSVSTALAPSPHFPPERYCHPRPRCRSAPRRGR